VPVSKFRSKFRALIQVPLAVAMIGGSPAMTQVAAPAPPMPSMAMPAMPGHAGHDDNLVPKVPTLLTGYGQGGFTVTTASPAAQAFFDNGMQLAHAFAHKAAIAAFAEARRLDPVCAMCAWGEAWSSGPTINYDKDAAEIAALAIIADTAAKLANPPTGPRATQRERDLIAALRSRYRGHNGDLVFAQAMERLVTTYPADNEIGTIAADAWLIAPRPPGARTPNSWRSMALLETILARDPNYSPAIHFYIHATEIAGQPARAEPYADRLTALAPSASHLVHMPSHTWYWVGRYQDAADANMRAVALGIANAKRLGLPEPDGIWGLPYHEHNVTFGIGAALMAGDARTALALGRPLIARAQVAREAPVFRQMISAQGYFAISHFADPAEMLALPEPVLPFLKGYYHYGRGEAFARLGNIAAVRAEAAAIAQRVPGAADAEAATSMLAIARLVLVGRAAMLGYDPRRALDAFTAAARIEEGHVMADASDPPAWWYPVRRDAAAARLALGDTAGALRDLDTSLRNRPRDPVALAMKARAASIAPR
jgi:hypothetical protein